MAEGLGHERWTHTSLICALIANTHRDPKKHRPFKVDDFNPYARTDHKPRHTVDKHDLKLLREAFTSQKDN